MTIEFQAWPKIPRLNRPVTITEKIDGTNSCVIVDGPHEYVAIYPKPDAQVVSFGAEGKYLVAAQSRKRLITPEDDNFGFAAWVFEHAPELVRALGPGRHFGEWWGQGIQRGYGLTKGEKRFSLFNTKRWDVLSEATDDQPLGVLEDWTDVPGLRVVPILAQFDTFDTSSIRGITDLLRKDGSFAAPGFNNPEGVVVYHHAANSCFKVLLEGDEIPKSVTPEPTASRVNTAIPWVTRAMETRAQHA